MFTGSDRQTDGKREAEMATEAQTETRRPA